ALRLPLELQRDLRRLAELERDLGSGLNGGGSEADLRQRGTALPDLRLGLEAGERRRPEADLDEDVRGPGELEEVEAVKHELVGAGEPGVRRVVDVVSG